MPLFTDAHVSKPSDRVTLSMSNKIFLSFTLFSFSFSTGFTTPNSSKGMVFAPVDSCKDGQAWSCTFLTNVISNKYTQSDNIIRAQSNRFAAAKAKKGHKPHYTVSNIHLFPPKDNH